MTLNVLYTANHNYVNIMASSLLSLIMNNKDTNIHFHIITSAFTEIDYILINNIIKGASNCQVSYYDLDNYDISKYSIPDWRGTQIANARLFFADIIETKNMGKLLYLDSDTVVVGDLSDLLKVDASISAVPETVLKYKPKALGIDKYYNSGVLLFDVPSWIENEYQKRIIDFKRNHPNIILKYPDQDLLNVSIGESISELPYEYNILPYALIDYLNFNKSYYKDKRKTNSNVDIESSIQNKKIYHSAGLLSIKPWMENKVNPMNKDFEKYIEMINPDLNKEKLHGIKQILANNMMLLYFVLYLKTCVLPESLVETAENISLKRQ